MVERQRLQDILPPTDRVRRAPPLPKQVPPTYVPPPVEDFDDSFEKPRFPFRLIIGAVIVILLIGGAVFGVSTLFAGTEIIVHPKVSEVFLDAEVVTAVKDDTAASLHYIVFTKTFSKSAAVEATGSQQVSEKASGQITIENRYSTRSQRLVETTRFQTADGLIFRTPTAVTVPGYRGEGESMVPGQVTITVFADEAGENYNVAPSTFTLPGFKDSPQFSKITARSTAAFAGGFVGNRPSVAAATKDKTVATLHEEMTEELAGWIETELPEGYLFVPDWKDLLSVSYRTLAPVAAEGGKVTLTEEAQVRVIALHAPSLARLIAERGGGGYTETQGVRFENASQFSISIDGAPAVPWEESQLPIRITGGGKLIADIDIEALKLRLAGQPEENVPLIVAENKPGLDSLEVKFRPFWNRTFPQNPESIKAKLEVGK